VSGFGGLPPERVPTLTEEVAWPESAPARVAPPPPAEAMPVEALRDEPMSAQELQGEADVVGAAMLQALMVNEEQITQRVLVELERQVELMLEYRLREVLTPVLTRAADSLIRDARSELASTLRDVVARAVAQELARHRTR
jgi:hypothetical protein